MLFFKVATAIVVVIGIVFIVQSDWLAQLRVGDSLETAELFSHSLPFLLMVSFLFIVVQSVVTVIPLALILLFNYFMLGFWQGYVWSLLTSITASLIAFLLYRYWLQSFVHRKVKREWMKSLENNGFWFVTISRLIPVMPSSLINLAAGSSSIRVMTFSTATLLGNGLYLFAVFLLMEGLLAVGTEWILALVVFFVGLGLFLKRRAKVLKGV
ncbi:putative membrane protein YdjX (TVP38/TMEM64 family) [Alkalihalobacillus xiaoxiensis]|uniref:TVP38/TMEM64 family membrane protein n=1 Tax=Shouchella xiaoxiensis TaxID=766895 RepID=A0ABS2SP37_9BACI|nr:VTT domain-containing protein [Shouchella xiaoxiensis]MBM7837288.1 putative membrane protein YdjX (TVP38/TMEM64 family) [Shouchella xiaoxiensis]